MRRRVVISGLAGGALAATLAATGAIAGTDAASSLASVAPVTAAASTPAEVSTCPGCSGGGEDALGRGEAGNRNGMARHGMSGDGRSTDQSTGNGMRGQGRNGSGVGGQQNLPASGTLTADQLAELGAMAEEEKLAHDVYVALGEATGDARFTRIAASEERHLAAVRTLLDRYGQPDPTEGLAAGQFAGADVTTLYNELVSRGRVSLDAALGVGRTIERMDIADLTQALEGLDAPDVQQVYTALRNGSQNHLRAFGG